MPRIGRATMGSRFQRERYRQSQKNRRIESAEAVKRLGEWWKARKATRPAADLTEPCSSCPFAGMSAAMKLAAVEGESPQEMLCHESQCLDGEQPDRRCAGFHGSAP